MPTVRQIVSDIDQSLKALNISDWISPKSIYSRLQATTSDFLSKANSSRLIYKNDRALTEIDGIQMELAPITSCSLDVYSCDRVMKSKLPLPNIYTSKFGSIVPEVMSINFGTEYFNCFTPKQWKAISKREFDDGKRYFFMLNNFLYIPIKRASEQSPEEIRMLAMFRDRYSVYKFKQVIGACEECKKEESCKRPLDFEIVLPDFLEMSVKEKVILDLANVYLKVVPSEAENLNPNDKNSQRQIQNRKLTNS